METENHKKSEVSFKWWDIWAWISIFILLTYTSYAWYTYGNQTAITFLIITNSISIVLYIYVLKYNKYAFLLATILSFNIILWVINGVYLKRRWEHSKVNKNKIYTHKFWKILIFLIILILIFLFKLVTIQTMRYKLTEPVKSTTNINTKNILAKQTLNDFDINSKPKHTNKNQKLIHDLNKDLPRMIDEVTRLDRIDINNTTTTYKYTLIGLSFDKEIILQQKELLKDLVCDRKLTHQRMEKGKYFSYHYYDQDQSTTHTFNFGIKDCKVKLVKKTFLNTGIKLYEEKKYEEARDLFIQSIDNNETRAYLWLAYFHKKGLAVKQDPNKAMELNLLGCDKGDGECCHEVAKLKYINSNKSKINIYYKKACDLGIGDACFSYANNNKGVDLFGRSYVKNIKKAIPYFEMGCDLKNAKSCIALADLYKDPFKSNDYYNKACKLKIGRACNQLGINYAKGIGKRKNIEVARYLFGQACDNKYQSGCSNYANMGKDWEFHNSNIYTLPKLTP